MKNSFLKYLEYEKRYSQHTITSYSNDLNQFETFVLTLDPENKIEQADHNLIRNWIINLVERNISPRSVNRKITTLRTFYKFLIKRGLAEKDPTFKIKILKTKKQLPRFVSEKELVELFNRADFKDDFLGCRDRLIFELLYGTGIRLSELINLKHSDIDLFDQTIRVLGKRKKERVIPFTKNLKRTIENYSSKKNDHFHGNAAEYLIVTDNGEQSYPMNIYRVVKKYLDQYTTVEKRSPHLLRHTFATHLLEKGADLNAVKDLLGHANLAATQVYTHNSLEKLKKVFDQAHPKA
ncbi:MAG: tyrosine-type recombinase/integrase [Candidatus Cyclobacteriaceae bacterium M3_2C_046]